MIHEDMFSRRPFVCQSRSEMQTKLRSEKKDLAEERRRCRAIGKENKEFKAVVDSQQRMIDSQKFVMTNLRNGIDYLKNTCKDVGEVIMNGCTWAEWAPYTVCSKTCGGGRKVRLRNILHKKQSIFLGQEQGEAAWHGNM